MSNRNTKGRPATAAGALGMVAIATALAVGGVGALPVTAAHADPVPAAISSESPVTDVLRFAESSGARWRTLSAAGRIRSGGADRPFKVSATRDGRCRAECGDDLRVRNGRERLDIDRAGGKRRAYRVPQPSPAAEQSLAARMSAHQADDPTLAREGEVLIDTPLNDLISPARIVRNELGMAASSVVKRGSARVAGREAVVLEARFPAELAKEDHWDVYVDVQTGVLLGLVIEPLEGEDRYEMFVESLSVDEALPEALFDCADGANG